jgi:hypothetical protein
LSPGRFMAEFLPNPSSKEWDGRKTDT